MIVKTNSSESTVGPVSYKIFETSIKFIGSSHSLYPHLLWKQTLVLYELNTILPSLKGQELDMGVFEGVVSV